MSSLWDCHKKQPVTEHRQVPAGHKNSLRTCYLYRLFYSVCKDNILLQQIQTSEKYNMKKGELAEREKLDEEAGLINAV
jgi:hypothetical protein